MDEKEKTFEENYEYLYKDYFEAKKGDTDDMIFAALIQDKTHSEK